MTYNEAMSIIKNPYELNRKDAAIEGDTDAQEGDSTKGYRIYTVDEKGHRLSPVRHTASDVENNVYYWYNKRIAKAYMVYLAEAMPQQTYGLYKVEAIKGNRENMELLYNEHTAHYGQVASHLHVTEDAMTQVLTPEMLQQAKKEPDRQLFSED